MIPIVTVCNKKFLVGLEVLLKSIKLTNPWYEGTVYVISDDLTLMDLEYCATLYSCNIIKPIGDYTNIDNTLKVLDRYNFAPLFRKYEVFRLKWSRVLFLDVDLLVIGDIKALFETECDFGAVLDKAIDYRYFNTGVMSISKKYLNNEFFNKLMTITPFELKNPTIKPHFNTVPTDNEIICSLIEKDGSYRFPNKYNTLKFHYKNFGSQLIDVRIIHYVIKKPWDTEYKFTHIDEYYNNCPLAESIWNEYYEKRKTDTA